MLRIRVCGSVIKSCPHYGTVPPPTKLSRNVYSHQACAAFKIFNSYCQLWKILKEMGIPDHLTCLLRNLYTGQEATVRTGHGTTAWFQIEKGVHQGCILSPCLFNFYAEYIMRNAGLEEAQAGIKIARRISITSDMLMTPPLWQKVKKN